jgi:hypothetical protein
MAAGRRSLSSLAPVLTSLINSTQIPDNKNTAMLAYTGNDGSIMSKAPPTMGAIIPPLSVDKRQKKIHTEDINKGDAHPGERRGCATGRSSY